MITPYTIGLAALAVIGAFFFGYRCGGMAAKEKAATDHVAQLTALAAAYQSQQIKLEQKEAAHDAETVNDNALADAPYPDVRMCHYIPADVPSATTQPGPTTSAGVLPTKRQGDLVQSESIGPELHKLLAEADDVVANCRRDLP